MSDDIFDLAEGYRMSLAAMASATQASMGEPIPFDDATPKHMVYVQIKPDGFFASCMTCGCDPFPDRHTLAEAEADARAHGELRHNYPRSYLEQRERNTQGDSMAIPEDVGPVEGFKVFVETVEALAGLIESLIDLNQKSIKLEADAIAEGEAMVKLARTGMASMRDVIAQIEEVSG